jgi:hypothetical protein
MTTSAVVDLHRLRYFRDAAVALKAVAGAPAAVGRFWQALDERLATELGDLEHVQSYGWVTR